MAKNADLTMVRAIHQIHVPGAKKGEAIVVEPGNTVPVDDATLEILLNAKAAVVISEAQVQAEAALRQAQAQSEQLAQEKQAQLSGEPEQSGGAEEVQI